MIRGLAPPERKLTSGRPDCSHHGLYYRLRGCLSEHSNIVHTDSLQLGGATLTYSVLYLTIYLHKANRNVQHTLLQQSAGLLNATIEPPAPVPDPPPYEVKRAGLSEQLKDGWNSEVERIVQKIQTTDWTEQRYIYEQKISNAWRKLRQTEQAKEIEQKAKETVDTVKSNTKEGFETIRETIDTVKSNTKEGAEAVVGKAEAAKQKTSEPRLLDMK